MRVVLSLVCVSAFAGSNAVPSLASCANSELLGFSGSLAGCGAYERVTPEFKAGAEVAPVALSSTGSRVIGTSIAVFAGTEGYGLSATAVYDLTRTAVAWTASAISPSITSFPAQKFLDGNPDLDRSLWLAHRPSQPLTAIDLYLREPSGAFVKIGPTVPPYATTGPPSGTSPIFNGPALGLGEVLYAGASPDFSHILFQVRGEGSLWPGDKTAVNNNELSLYEYVDTGNSAPVLVGVKNGELISDCGTSLGSHLPGINNADSYNAISADGETVFFTAINAGECGAEHAPKVDEVYARIAKAKTVAISEPSVADCEVCQTSERAPAEFAGASSDGTKVFFTTSQELLKGSGGENLYEYDFHNRPGHKIIRISTGSMAPEVQGVMRVSEDGSHVYFVAKGVLTSGPNAEGGEPVAGQGNIYVFERDAAHPAGRLSFVATGGSGGGMDERAAQATPDGRFFVFGDGEDLTNGDTSSAPQVFEYDAQREELVRVSVGQRGYPQGQESVDLYGAFMTAQTYGGALQVMEGFSFLAVSDDGSVVTFISSGGLTEAAKAAGEAQRESVYEYRSSGGVIGNGEVFSVSSGDPRFGSGPRGIDHAGDEVLFRTQAPVLSTDGDSQEDLYVARDGGGFPVAPLVQNCELLSSCQGGSVAAPVFGGGVGSASVTGNANLAESAAPPPSSLPKSKGPSRAERLARAFRACRKAHRPGRRRHACEVGARRRLGVKTKGRG